MYAGRIKIREYRCRPKSGANDKNYKTILKRFRFRLATVPVEKMSGKKFLTLYDTLDVGLPEIKCFQR